MTRIDVIENILFADFILVFALPASDLIIIQMSICNQLWYGGILPRNFYSG